MERRLDEGRTRLRNADRALNRGRVTDARRAYEAALEAYRGPVLRLGEAQALRGLALVAMREGDVRSAEERTLDALRGFRAVREWTDQHPDAASADALEREAGEGEGAALVQLGEILLRTGRSLKAREALAEARNAYLTLGEEDSAAIWNALGRLEMREGRFDEARVSLERALDRSEQDRDVGGQGDVLLSLAELHRTLGHTREAQKLLLRALPLVREARHPVLVARTLLGLGALMLQLGRPEEGATFYEQALQEIDALGDPVMRAFGLLGRAEARSRAGRVDAVDTMLEAATLLRRVSHYQGLGTALLCVARHGVRHERPDLVLAGCEGAWRFCEVTDPVLGVERILRLVIRGFAARRMGYPTLVAALAWDVASGGAEDAVAVRAHVVERSPPDWVGELEALDLDDLLERCRQHLRDVLAPLVERLDQSADAFGSVTGTLHLLGQLAARVGDLAPEPVEAGELPPDSDELVLYDTLLAHLRDVRTAGEGPLVDDAPSAPDSFLVIEDEPPRGRR